MIFFIRESAYYFQRMLSALYAIARPFDRGPSLCLSDTCVNQSKAVEVRIMKFSPYGSSIPQVFAWYVSSRNFDGLPDQGR